ncbi:MAG: GxxExxY protein [Saprospiraceae bacterium]
MTSNEISNIVLNCAYKVHSALGPGLLESAYQQCLAYELRKANLRVEIEKPLELFYNGVKMDCAYRLDLWIEGKFLVELKTVKQLEPIHTAQVISYLKLSKTRLALLLNFNEKSLRDGVKRVIQD